MKKGNTHSHGRIPQESRDYGNETMGQGWLSRLLATLNFVVVIIFLGAWITAFIFLNQYFASILSGDLLTSLTCISFFGGLILAFLVAATASSLLHRLFWKSSIFHRSDVKN